MPAVISGVRASLGHFLALLPTRIRLPPALILEVADRSNLPERRKYSFGKTRTTDESGVKTTLRLEYREQQKKSLDERNPGWRSDPAALRVFDYLFGTEFLLHVEACGRLKITFPLPVPKDLDLGLLVTELDNHLFHASKFIVRALQAEALVPQDFEYKRYLTDLSTDPVSSLLQRLERVVFTEHSRIMDMAIRNLKRMGDLLGTRWRRVLFASRLGAARKLDWDGMRLHALGVRSQITWYYWMAWHGLPDHEAQVLRVLGGRTQHATAELRDAQEEFEWFIGKQNHHLSRSDALVGLVLGALSLTPLAVLSVWLLVPVILVPALFGFGIVSSMLRSGKSLEVEARAISEIFRCDYHVKDSPPALAAVRH